MKYQCFDIMSCTELWEVQHAMCEVYCKFTYKTRFCARLMIRRCHHERVFVSHAAYRMLDFHWFSLENCLLSKNQSMCSQQMLKQPSLLCNTRRQALNKMRSELDGVYCRGGRAVWAFAVSTWTDSLIISSFPRKTNENQAFCMRHVTQIHVHDDTA
jgi:hypothetical protein